MAYVNVMLDINGMPIVEGDTAQILCQVIELKPTGVVVRIMNSDMELLIGAKHDEVLGGLVADSELTLFEATNSVLRSDPADDQADGVKILFE